MKAAAALLIAGVLVARAEPPAVNRDAAIVNEFEKRVDSYLKLRQDIEAQMGRLKTTPSEEKISHHEGDLRHKLREARADAREGDIFTPEISMEIRRLIGLAMQPTDAAHIKQSLRRSEPVQLHLKVNDKYPEPVPLQTTPPTLLGNLPELPPEIEYRITGRDLVLLDTKANLVVDVLRGVFS
jgi:hypothetical protein